MDRCREIRELLKMSPGQVVRRAGKRLIVCRDIQALHRRFAADLFTEIREAFSEGGVPRLILPVGPTGQYPLLAERINRERLSLAGGWFFFMDEYADDDGRAIAPEHPLSFRGTAQRVFFDRLEPELRPEPGHVVFPSEHNIEKLGKLMRRAGGIGACFGGVGIHGHVAFNEPERGVQNSGPRLVTLNDFTVTINAVRAHVGGNLECFPRAAFTVGMREIREARRVRLYCRNGCPFDWANTVLRLALFGHPGDDYPVTWLGAEHPDFRIITDKETLASPQNLL